MSHRVLGACIRALYIAVGTYVICNPVDRQQVGDPVPQDTSEHRGRREAVCLRHWNAPLILSKIITEKPGIAVLARLAQSGAPWKVKVTAKSVTDGAKHLGIGVNIFYCC